jgi:signal transduction histidine kinase
MARPPSPSETHRLRSIHWIVGSTIVLVLVSILGGLALMLFAARQLDRMESIDEHELVERTIQSDLKRMTRELTSATVWDDAYRAMGPTVDMAWADANFAEYYHRYFGHDLTFAVRDGKVTYASLAGVRVKNSALGALPKDARPLIDAVAARSAKARAAGVISLEGESTAAGLIRSGDEVYFVAAADVIADTREAAARGSPPSTIVLSARRLSGAVIRSMDEDLGVSGLTLISNRKIEAPGVALIDANRKVIGGLAWTARNPSMSLLRSAMPWLVIGFLIMAAAGLMLFLRVAESLAKMAANRLDLIQAKEQAETANVAKTQFLANMSHEIRTPLNGVLGMAQIMEADQLTQPQRERLGIINESGQALLSLLNSILDMARLESGGVKLREESFNLDTLIESSCAAFSGAAASKGIVLSYTIAPDCQGAWLGDPMRLRQVIGNLVANAVKFTDKGSVRLVVRHTQKGVRVAISDTGVGIAPADQAKLFMKFSQVDNSITRAHDGSGLGLAICQELVGMMGGKIGVDSAPGAGSTFHFDIALRRPRTERPSLRLVERA